MKYAVVVFSIMLAGIVMGEEGLTNTPSTGLSGENKKPAVSNNSEIEKVFLNPLVFKIAVIKTETEWAAEPGVGVPDRTSKVTQYVMRLENQSTVLFKDLRVDQCLYRNKKIKGNEFVETNAFRKTIGMIGGSATNEVRLTGAASYRAPASGFLNELIGGYFRVILPLPDGREIIREIRVPDTLSETEYTWKDPAK